MDELVSVIVPVFNSEKYLERCIKSIVSQEYSRLEIILIDDGSTDSSGDICEAFAKSDNRIIVHHQENAGVCVARNKGIEMSTGKYITFVDSDDYILENYISILMENMNDRLDLVISKPDALTPDGKRYKYWPFNNKTAIEMETTDLRNMDWRHRHLWMAGVLYRRELIGDLRFDTRYYVGEDLLFYFSVLKKSKLVKYISEKPYCYILYDESAAHGSFNDKKFTEFYAWQDICKMYEGHPLYERFLENFELRCCRLYMAMLKDGFAEDERTNDLVKAIRANLKYGLRIHGYPTTYIRNFIWFSILPKSFHKKFFVLQDKYIRFLSGIVSIVKKIIKL